MLLLPCRLGVGSLGNTDHLVENNHFRFDVCRAWALPEQRQEKLPKWYARGTQPHTMRRVPPDNDEYPPETCSLLYASDVLRALGVVLLIDTIL
jgi:hypothetical protein